MNDNDVRRMQICDWEPPPLRLLSPENHVDIWSASMMDLSDHIEELVGILSEDEVKRADAFYFPKDRAQYIIAHGILRLILGKYEKAPPAAIAFQKNAHGKPSMVQRTANSVRFNLSHSNDGILMAFTRAGDVGIDIERTRTAVSVAEIVRGYFSRKEIEEFDRLAGGDRNFFYTLWTRKEAFIKAVGSGLSYSLDKFSVTTNGTRIFQWSPVSTGETDTGTWHIKSLKMFGPYRAAIAIHGPPLPTFCWRIRDIAIHRETQLISLN